jgi:GNAT superfamily N-acetyltransferase
MSIEIVSADDSAGLQRFIGVSWRVHDRARGPWVPPLRVMVKDTLAPRRDPFWRNADRALFVALRDGRPVGRIAAIENRSHNAHHGDRLGFFGFFECVDDGEVAAALLARAADWLRGRGLTAMRGPMSPSINHECGLLVDGCDTPPAFLTPWNPPYYAALLEGCGLAKERDLLGFWIPTDAAAFDLTPAMARAAERARARLGRLTFQSLDGPGFERNAELCRVIFNEAWSGNWGFVPIAPDEFAYLTRELKPILFAQLSFIAEVDGEPAGFMVLIRELNEILARIPSGRLLPTGLFKLLAGVPRLRRGRVILLGIRERYRGQHILPLFMQELLRRSRDPGFRGVGAEASWVLEDNEAMIRPLTTMGAAPYKRWRIYRGEL